MLDIAEVLDPIGALDSAAVHVTGLAVYTAGLTGVIVSQAAMGASWRIGTDPAERTELVTSGPFRFVRNPIYVAVIATLMGLALLVPSVVALASVATFLVSVEVETRAIEEPHLRRVHGEAYRSYAARVGRFVPGIGRLPAGQDENPSRRFGR